MSSMHAVVLRKDSTTPSIEELPIPQPAPGQARVRIAAAALNHRDVWISKGQYARIVYPVIPGSDGSGIVDAIGDESAADWLGREVVINPNVGWGSSTKAQSNDYGILGMPSQGTMAEYVCLNYDRLIDKPQHLSFAQAAALPLAGLTAYRALVRQGGVKAQQNVLVSGIGGGVALFVLQFAKALGARVYVGSTRQEKLDAALRIGADGGVLTNEAGWNKHLGTLCSDIDLVVDSLGGEYVNDFLNILVPGGRLVSYGATLGSCSNLEIRRIFWKQIQWYGSTMGSDEDFHDMIALVQQHHLVPQIDSLHPLVNAADAFERMAASRQFGKIIVSMS